MTTKLKQSQDIFVFDAPLLNIILKIITTQRREILKKEIPICSLQHWYCVVRTTRHNKTAELLGDYCMGVDC